MQSVLECPGAAPSVSTIDAAKVSNRFHGSWMNHDRANNCIVSNEIEFWATADGCGMTARPLVGVEPGELGERIEFDDPKIIWAFTCMMRLMLRQGTISFAAGDA